MSLIYGDLKLHYHLFEEIHPQFIDINWFHKSRSVVIRWLENPVLTIPLLFVVVSVILLILFKPCAM
jgi:hypothetical protein